jgi:hypothetical protein
MQTNLNVHFRRDAKVSGKFSVPEYQNLTEATEKDLSARMVFYSVEDDAYFGVKDDGSFQNLGGGSSAELVVETNPDELHTLIENSDLIPGQLYKITEAHKYLEPRGGRNGRPERLALYNEGTNAGTNIWLRALTENQIESEGVGEFFNPAVMNEFDNVSTFTVENITGEWIKGGDFTSADNMFGGKLVGYIEEGKFVYYNTNGQESGEFPSQIISAYGGTADIIPGSISLKTYNAGDRIQYGGYVWENLAGTLGATQDILNMSADWQKLNYSNDGAYVRTLDKIRYDVSNDLITAREDAFGQQVSYTLEALRQLKENSGVSFYPIHVLKWGTANASLRVIDSYIVNVNDISGIYQNSTIKDFSFFVEAQFKNCTFDGANFTRSGFRYSKFTNVFFANLNIISGGGENFEFYGGYLGGNYIETTIGSTYFENVTCNRNNLNGSTIAFMGVTKNVNIQYLNGTGNIYTEALPGMKIFDNAITKTLFMSKSGNTKMSFVDLDDTYKIVNPIDL